MPKKEDKQITNAELEKFLDVVKIKKKKKYFEPFNIQHFRLRRSLFFSSLTIFLMKLQRYWTLNGSKQKIGFALEAHKNFSQNY